MSIQISGRNYEVTERNRTLFTSKLDTIRKYFDDILEVRCVLSQEKHRHICEVIVIGKEQDVKSVQQADTMEEAIQSTVDHLKRQAQKNRDRIRDHHKRERGHAPDNWDVNVLEPSNLRLGPRMPRIIKTSRLPIRPMSIEQAAMMLDDSKNDFVVFQDVDTEKVSVIYKRQDKNFGLISPEF